MDIHYHPSNKEPYSHSAHAVRPGITREILALQQSCSPLARIGYHVRLAPEARAYDVVNFFVMGEINENLYRFHEALKAALLGCEESLHNCVLPTRDDVCRALTGRTVCWPDTPQALFFH